MQRIAAECMVAVVLFLHCFTLLSSFLEAALRFQEKSRLCILNNFRKPLVDYVSFHRPLSPQKKMWSCSFTEVNSETWVCRSHADIYLWAATLFTPKQHFPFMQKICLNEELPSGLSNTRRLGVNKYTAGLSSKCYICQRIGLFARFLWYAMKVFIFKSKDWNDVMDWNGLKWWKELTWNDAWKRFSKDWFHFKSLYCRRENSLKQKHWLKRHVSQSFPSHPNTYHISFYVAWGTGSAL